MHFFLSFSILSFIHSFIISRKAKTNIFALSFSLLSSISLIFFFPYSSPSFSLFPFSSFSYSPPLPPIYLFIYLYIYLSFSALCNLIFPSNKEFYCEGNQIKYTCFLWFFIYLVLFMIPLNFSFTQL